MFWIRLALVSVATVVLSACGGNGGGGGNPISGNSSGGGVLVLPGQVGGTDPSPSSNTIARTIRAPSGGNVSGSVVRYCLVSGSDCATPLQQISITSSGSSAPFSTPALTAGSYIVAAGKDNTGDGDLNDPTDWFVCANSCNPIASPQSTLNLQMQLNGAAASAKVQSMASALELPEIVAGEVLVKFKPSVSLQTVGFLRATVAGQSVEAMRVRRLSLPDTELYRANLDARGTLEFISQLNGRSDVEFAEPNYISRAFKTPNDPGYPRQWHYPAMNLPAAWDITDGTTGTPVTVAVVDTGSISHPDLNAAFVGGYDFISSLTEADDGNGRDSNPNDEGGDSGYHGAHVAGTIAARSNNGIGVAGVSWGARVVPLRVLGINGSGSGVDILEAVSWAAGESVSGIPANPNPAKIINMSLGGKRACSASEQTLFTRLKNNGVIVVVAAGNSNDNAALYAPASCNDVITVGATGPQNERARYSNFGAPVDVMAPGGDTQKTIRVGGQTFDAGVLSTVLDSAGQPGFTSYNGTSMAAPHIAGVVALMLSRDSTLTFETVLARLRSSATATSACNSPIANGCGAGLVDAAKAVSATGGGGGGGGGTPPPPPAPPQTGTAKIYVAALACKNSSCSGNDPFDDSRSKAVEVSGNTQNIEFKVSNLVSGTFVFAGWQDLNGDEEINGNDGFGFTNAISIANNQNRNDILIRLKPYTSNRAGAVALESGSLETALERMVR